MKYLSLFSGIGGFELGIQQAYENLSKTARTQQGGLSHNSTDLEQQRLAPEQPTCIGFSEIDKYATAVYQYHFPEHKNYGDITKIDEKTLPDFELLVGGFPCQSFSIAGKRAGFDDTRGTLFFEIARIVREKQPRLLLLENVKGLLSHDQGSTFRTIITTLDELGYDCQWQVLNSKNHGVPQNRERVFIVGHLRGTPRPEVFPFGKDDQISDREDESKQRRTQAEISHTIRGSNIKADQVFVKVPEATKKGYAIAHEGDSINLSVPNSKTRRGRVGKNIAQTLDTGMQQHTLTSDMKIRRLTPLECERLQGFPDGWTEYGGNKKAENIIFKNPEHVTAFDKISDTQRYKMCGNAVTVNVIRDIFEKLL